MNAGAGTAVCTQHPVSFSRRSRSRATFLNVPERVPDRLLNDRPERILDVSETVVDPKPIPTRVDEAGSAKIGQVSRRFCLRNPKAVVNVANTDFARRQQAQDSQPSAIRKSLQERFQAEKCPRHICVLTNISRDA